MSLITWDSSLNLDIPEIDEQHQRLVVIINNLHQAMSEGRSSQVILPTVHELIRYTRYHFASEERLMDEQRLAYSMVHKKEHRAFIDVAVDWQSRVDAGEKISSDILHYLRHWMWGHLRVSDRKLAQEYHAAKVRTDGSAMDSEPGLPLGAVPPAAYTPAATKLILLPRGTGGNPTGAKPDFIPQR